MLAFLARIWGARKDLPSQEKAASHGETFSRMKFRDLTPPGVFTTVFKESHAKLLAIL